MSFEERDGGGGGKFATQAYWNAFHKLRAAWQEVFGEELEKRGSLGMQVYENALRDVKARLLDDKAMGAKFRDVLDVKVDEPLENVLLAWADMEDVTPAQVRQAIFEEGHRLGSGRHELRPFLRKVLDAVFENTQTRRPRVGPNRHWPRLLQYLREVEDDTDWSPYGRGLKLANIGGRGPVAKKPIDPSLLSVVIDIDYLS